MEVTIIFEAQVTIKGENIREIREKWEDMELFADEAKECDAEYRDTIAVEDENYNDVDLDADDEDYDEDDYDEDE